MEIKTMKEHLQLAIRFTRDELGSGGELRGYALCTDDGLSTLFCMCVLEQELSASDDAELVFQPMDWPRETGGVFEALSDEMYDRYEQTDDVEVHAREMFGLLVDALRTAKSEGVFDDQVFLTVLSTDPSEFLDALEDSAVEILNPPSVVRRWRDFLLRHSVLVLPDKG